MIMAKKKWYKKTWFIVAATAFVSLTATSIFHTVVDSGSWYFSYPITDSKHEKVQDATLKNHSDSILDLEYKHESQMSAYKSVNQTMEDKINQVNTTIIREVSKLRSGNGKKNDDYYLVPKEDWDKYFDAKENPDAMIPPTKRDTGKKLIDMYDFSPGITNNPDYNPWYGGAVLFNYPSIVYCDSLAYYIAQGMVEKEKIKDNDLSKPKSIWKRIFKRK